MKRRIGKIFKDLVSNRIVHRFGQIIGISITALASLLIIIQVILPQFLPPKRKPLDIIIVEELPDAIDQNLYLIRIRCKRLRTGTTDLINDFELHIAILEGTIEQVTHTGIVPTNQRELEEALKRENISSIPCLQYPPIDEAVEFTMTLLLRTDAGMPKLQLVGLANGQKVKIIKWQEVLDSILPRIR